MQKLNSKQLQRLRGIATASLELSKPDRPDLGIAPEDLIVACDVELGYDTLESEDEDERRALIETYHQRCAEAWRYRPACKPLTRGPRSTMTAVRRAKATFDSRRDRMQLQNRGSMRVCTEEERAHLRENVCPVLNAFGGSLNARLTDEERQLLAPLIPRLIGSRSTPEVELRRACLLIDGVLRRIVPMSLDIVKWTDLAKRLRGIEAVVDIYTARVAEQIARLVSRATCKRCEDGEDGDDSACASFAVADVAAALTEVSYAFDAVINSASLGVATDAFTVAEAFASGAGGFFATSSAIDALAGGSFNSSTAASSAVAAAASSAAYAAAVYAPTPADIKAPKANALYLVAARRFALEATLCVYEEAIASMA
jgi:hypothetical protein